MILIHFDVCTLYSDRIIFSSLLSHSAMVTLPALRENYKKFCVIEKDTPAYPAGVTFFAF